MQLIKTKSFTLATYSKGDLDSKKLALVIPGKLDTKDYAHMRSHVDFLANLGYFALSFDPPGTWESPGDISLYTMSNYIKAVHEVIEYYENKPTFVMGHSMGGKIAIIAESQNKYIFSYSAIMPPLGKSRLTEKEIADWKEKGFKVSLRALPPGDGPKTKELIMPYTFLEDQLQYELTDKIRSSNKPKLFILGKRDILIAPEKIKEAFTSFYSPKELYELDSGHDYRRYPEKINEVNAVINKFLSEYTKD